MAGQDTEESINPERIGVWSKLGNSQILIGKISQSVRIPNGQITDWHTGERTARRKTSSDRSSQWQARTLAGKNQIDDNQGHWQVGTVTSQVDDNQGHWQVQYEQ